MSLQSRYHSLIQRHLGRGPKRSDGYTKAAIATAERRLKIKLPAAVREYYLIAGRLVSLN